MTSEHEIEARKQHVEKWKLSIGEPALPINLFKDAQRRLGSGPNIKRAGAFLRRKMIHPKDYGIEPLEEKGNVTINYVKLSWVRLMFAREQPFTYDQLLWALSIYEIPELSQPD
jgi:hypothetical protein